MLPTLKEVYVFTVGKLQTNGSRWACFTLPLPRKKEEEAEETNNSEQMSSQTMAQVFRK